MPKSSGVAVVDINVNSDDEEGDKKEVNLPKPDDLKHPFDVFDLTSLTWSTQSTSGKLDDEENIPELGIGSTLSYHKGTHSMYLYGGWKYEKFSSDVFCISMDTWEWEKIVIPDDEIKPSPRYLTGVLLHEDRLCNFAGVGLAIVEGQDKGAKYISSATLGITHYSYGWNNEYYEFDVIKSELH